MKTVLAYINENRILADCPNCNGAEFVEPGGLFVCSNCHPEVRGLKHISVGGYSFPVTDPIAGQAARQEIVKSGLALRVVAPPDINDIRRVLNLRPSVANMNWFPAGHLRKPKGETLQDILLENIDNGAPIPDDMQLAGGA